MIGGVRRVPCVKLFTVRVANKVRSFIQVVLFAGVRSLTFATAFAPMAIGFTLDFDENAANRFLTGHIQRHVALQQAAAVAHLLRVIGECNCTSGWHFCEFALSLVHNSLLFGCQKQEEKNCIDARFRENGVRQTQNSTNTAAEKTNRN